MCTALFVSGFPSKPNLIYSLSMQMSGQVTFVLGFRNFISLQCVTVAPSAKELKTILLSENYSVYHSVGVLQGSANSAFAGKIALKLKIILRSTL